MAELLVNVPQMQRDLQRAREDNAYLRTLLRQMNIDDVGAPREQQNLHKNPRSKELDDNEDFDNALARRQARLDTAASTNEASSTVLELKSANDRVAQLERQLLDAEETICHLKAEKLAALRDVERLIATTTDREERSPNKNDSEQQRKLVLELETRLAEQKQAHTLEQDQRMAVIRDQELELKTLRDQLEEKTKQYKELQQRHMDLLEMDDQAATMKQRVTSGVSQFSIYGEESDDDDESKVTKPQKDVPGRARAPADADSVNPKWHEELVRHPTPHFDLESPEVAYILRAWTNNIKKMRYLRRWLIQVVKTKGPLPEDFPMGVELPRLPPEVRDGFLTLVLPLLRQQTEREILAHSRRYNDGVHTDLRFRLVPRE
ncbi:hypothetical protein F442_00097 [Phytophthora nicotianae P10297]|uniref:Uncharacterized protein n=2 Tax=Phytophthora nicotianae TaxID=4792 RepID=W3A809_PHYNI|nr:hypothetical protein L917_00091 [Phytophthora nicotianae]ETP55311.1 hypothetical protein F442_00097 [Phytophthora nicotianae P10297]